nr:putative 50S ribosomal protein L3 N(5)-glutamine methyltransferase [uncultured bacterium]
MTLDQCIKESGRRLRESNAFFGHGTLQAEDDARWLVLHVAGLDDESFGMGSARDCNRLMSSTELESLEQLLKRRIQDRVPAAYLVGYSWFCGLKIKLSPDVLIPRSPVSELIESGFQPWLNPKCPVRALDLCTGSGCIAVAMASLWPHWRVDAADISSAACAIAKSNCAAHTLGGRLEILQGDLFAPCVNRRYDLIVANPPYVANAEYAILPAEYEAEPVLALVAGEDGLDIVFNILLQAAQYLEPGGILVCEVGHTDTQLISQLPAAPFMWFDFERGGKGVFMLERDQLLELEPQVREKMRERVHVQ